MEIKPRISVFSNFEKTGKTTKEIKKKIFPEKKNYIIIKFIIKWLENINKIRFLILTKKSVHNKETRTNFFNFFLKSVCKIFVELSLTFRFYFGLELNFFRLQKILSKTLDISDRFLKTDNENDLHKPDISIKKVRKNLHQNLLKKNYHGLKF